MFWGPVNHATNAIINDNKHLEINSFSPPCAFDDDKEEEEEEENG